MVFDFDFGDAISYETDRNVLPIVLKFSSKLNGGLDLILLCCFPGNRMLFSPRKMVLKFLKSIYLVTGLIAVSVFVLKLALGTVSAALTFLAFADKTNLIELKTSFLSCYIIWTKSSFLFLFLQLFQALLIHRVFLLFVALQIKKV